MTLILIPLFTKILQVSSEDLRAFFHWGEYEGGIMKIVVTLQWKHPAVICNMIRIQYLNRVIQVDNWIFRYFR